MYRINNVRTLLVRMRNWMDEALSRRVGGHLGTKCDEDGKMMGWRMWQNE